MQKHGERGRGRKKYFQNLETKVCVILFLKSLIMRASVRPSVLLGCCKFVLALHEVPVAPFRRNSGHPGDAELHCHTTDPTKTPKGLLPAVRQSSEKSTAEVCGKGHAVGLV
jgi:hypothetical protein